MARFAVHTATAWLVWETCTHISSVLFYLEALARLFGTSKACTEESCKWIIPEGSAIKDIDLLCQREETDYGWPDQGYRCRRCRTWWIRSAKRIGLRPTEDTVEFPSLVHEYMVVPISLDCVKDDDHTLLLPSNVHVLTPIQITMIKIQGWCWKPLYITQQHTI